MKLGSTLRGLLPATALLALTATAAFAQEAAAPAADAAAAVAEAVPVPDKGDTTWMLISTVLVFLMTVPGLALFYGGLVRTKNMLSVLMQVFTIACVSMIMWVVFGYSLAFTDGGGLNSYIGSFDKLFLSGVTSETTSATFTKGVVIPEYVFMAFQMTFAAITPGLIVGAFAERVKFSAVILFSMLWLVFSYYPIAHMVWFGAGAMLFDWGALDFAGGTVVHINAGIAGLVGCIVIGKRTGLGRDQMPPHSLTLTLVGAALLWVTFVYFPIAHMVWDANGLIFGWGAFDFAGGTVVHINAAIAGLVGAYVIGKRTGYGREAIKPHNLTLTMVGASILWVGWFGFNAGSALEAGGVAAIAFVNTFLATAAAVVAWLLVEWITKGKPSLLGAASGAVAGLVAITPAAGLVGLNGALAIGAIAGVLCLWGVSGLKKMLGADDSLDVFGVHGVGGITGALLTGVFAAPSLGGAGIWDYVTETGVAEYSIGSQVWIQAQGVLITVVLSSVAALVSYLIVKYTVGLRVPEEAEREGLDITSHGESAYHH